MPLTSSVEDSPPAFYQCEQCGTAMQQVSAANQSPLVMRCPHCGHEEMAEIQLSPEFAPLDKQGCRLVVYRQGETFSSQEIAAIRKLSERWQSMELSAALQQLQEMYSVDLGFWEHEQAQAMAERGLALGLDIRLADPQLAEPESEDGHGFGAPVSVGEGTIIPFAYILLALVGVAGLLLWFIC